VTFFDINIRWTLFILGYERLTLEHFKLHASFRIGRKKVIGLSEAFLINDYKVSRNTLCYIKAKQKLHHLV
jgi:hypothetical protein